MFSMKKCYWNTVISIFINLEGEKQKANFEEKSLFFSMLINYFKTQTDTNLKKVHLSYRQFYNLIWIGKIMKPFSAMTYVILNLFFLAGL